MTLPGLASCQEYEVSVMVRVGWASVACGEQCSLYRRHPASDSWTTEASLPSTLHSYCDGALLLQCQN